jgi:hypothetical protein
MYIHTHTHTPRFCYLFRIRVDHSLGCISWEHWILINWHVSDEYIFEYKLLLLTSILDHMIQLLSPASLWIVNCCRQGFSLQCPAWWPSEWTFPPFIGVLYLKQLRNLSSCFARQTFTFKGFTWNPIMAIQRSALKTN